MSARTQEDLRILAGAVIVPAVLGLALSVIWWAAGGDGTFYMTVSLPWLPFAVGLLISALLLPALVTLIAIYGGLKLFGFLGMLLAPLLVMVGMRVVTWKGEMR